MYKCACSVLYDLQFYCTSSECSNSLNIYDFESEIVHLVGALCAGSGALRSTPALKSPSVQHASDAFARVISTLSITCLRRRDRLKDRYAVITLKPAISLSVCFSFEFV